MNNNQSSQTSSKSIIIEIRAGVGGDEACLFAKELSSMYVKYAEKKSWKVSIISMVPGTVCGVKEVDISIKGQDAFKNLQYESGIHRVQRIPQTETRGRLHTSTASVVVIPEQETLNIQLNQTDLKIDLFHSSGKGGQNVNKVETAVRVTHIPTGIVVACQEERSQLMNKEKAMALLKLKLFNYYNDQRIGVTNAEKKSLIGNTDRSEKIRTYNYPRCSVTDHRIEYTIYNLDKYLAGNLDDMIAHMQA